MPHTADFIGKLRIKLIWYKTFGKKEMIIVTKISSDVKCFLICYGQGYLVLDFLFGLAEKSRFGDRSYSGMA